MDSSEGYIGIATFHTGRLVQTFLQSQERGHKKDQLIFQHSNVSHVYSLPGSWNKQNGFVEKLCLKALFTWHRHDSPGGEVDHFVLPFSLVWQLWQPEQQAV